GAYRSVRTAERTRRQWPAEADGAEPRRDYETHGRGTGELRQGTRADRKLRLSPARQGVRRTRNRARPRALFRRPSAVRMSSGSGRLSYRVDPPALKGRAIDVDVKCG